MTATVQAPAEHGTGLKKAVGFWGLMFVSLGSIIGSGWLLGALTAASYAGAASMISWVLAAFMLILLALVHADLGAAYPVAGGTARYPHFAFGALAGFTAGWAGYLQAVAIAPIEVEASISYVNSTSWAQDHLDMLHPSNGTLNGKGFVIAALAMLVFTIINLMGAKLLSDSNAVMVIWKFAIPALTVIVLISLRFHPGNFHAGGGFAPYGFHGVFAALPAGVVFALQGFEQASQMAGEAKNAKRDVSRAIIMAMLIGAALYIALEICFIGALDPSKIAHGWAHPIGEGDYGPYYTLALASGAGWLATLLIIDAVVSPAGTGLVYLGTSARISYALGEEETLPDQLTQISKRGVPVYSILLAFVIGLLAFLPFPSWASLVGLVTSATAIMYAFAPVSLAALYQKDPNREHPYRVPFPAITIPASFVAANLVIYWGGFEATWKLLTGIFIGRVFFEIALRRSPDLARADIDWRAASWIWPWLIGMTVIGLLGRYGNGSEGYFPEWVDLGVVLAWSLIVFYYAVSIAMSPEDVQTALENERQLDEELAKLAD